MNIANEINEIKNEIRDFNQEVRSNSSNISYDKFIKIVDLLDKFMKKIYLSDKYKIDNNKINNILSELLEAFNNNDFILMSDLFEYELLEEINNIL